MQPLSRVKADANVSFGQDDTMAIRPMVAVKIAECIAEWANIETMLGMFVALLLDTDGKTILAMYTGLENRAAQMRMVEAAAKSKLPMHHYEIFAVVMRAFVRPSMKQRDRLAHWCWGHSPELSDALLLMQPDEKMSLHLGAISPPKPIEFDRSKIFVVTEADIAKMVQRLRATTDHFAILMGTVWQSNTIQQRASLLEKLSNVPEIKAHVDRPRARS
jgi:hypothetical protein